MNRKGVSKKLGGRLRNCGKSQGEGKPHRGEISISHVFGKVPGQGGIMRNGQNASTAKRGVEEYPIQQGMEDNRKGKNEKK